MPLFPSTGRALPTESDESSESNLGRNAATAAMGAAPFMGLIGQKKIIHDPVTNPDINRFKSMRDLENAARAGDIIITTKPGSSIWKNVSSPISGTDLYHAQPVVDRSEGRAKTLTAGEFDEWKDPMKTKKQRRTLLRNADPITKAMKADEYPDVVLLRPKKRLSADELRTFQDEVAKRAVKRYDTVHALKTYLKDIFLPKIEGITNRGGVTCEGNVCSTQPAAAYEVAGRRVVPGKKGIDTLPADFLRSENFEAMGAHMPNAAKYRLPAWMQTARPYASRAALGLGMAGTTYALSEEPELAAAPLGALAASSLGGYLSNRPGAPGIPKKDPLTFSDRILRGNIMNSAIELSDELDNPAARKAIALKYLTRRGIPGLIGGAGAYLGTKALGNYLTSER